MTRKSLFSKLSDPSHLFIIAEAGSNWKCGNYSDDLKQAKKLVEVAVKSGADAIKFQTYSAETVYVPNAGKSKYLSTKGVQKDITEIFTEFSMPHKMLKELSSFCKKLGILFMSTPFSVNDASKVDEYVQIHKVASYELNHIPLLEFLASRKKPIILSTGASTYAEIDFALKVLRKKGAKEIALMQCTATYPASLESLNLRTITTFKKRYNIPVGLSDHSVEPFVAPLMSMGYGATILEKHFTLDKNSDGPDHFFALEPNELSLMIDLVRKSSLTSGSGEKKIQKEEKELRKFAVRSIQAIKKISEGEIFKEGYNIGILRPGNQKRGEDPRFLNKIEGKKSNRIIKIGEGIKLNDCY